MLKVEDICFTEEMILNKGSFLLVELSPMFEEGQTTEEFRIGTKAVVALTKHRLEKITVLIDDVIACSPFSDTELMEVRFNGFEGRYQREAEGEYVFNARARQLQIISKPFAF
ncbi:hypothetical protein I6N95_17520 [Vagococcus sp. BWB3-3]|uniref:Uncharacterized protein n=1 Tax=Vagococcus allomyrinae TaxID=2794353 RepID=A0A940PD99_9ENTE|nr:hypothetical protein [Vagococcus allomyrinae]MBP1042819.1 hypothetical protein [Vagococcus allomyrinae]